MIEEQRLSFEDYTAEEQERDVVRAMKLKEKYQPHLYLLKIEGMWCHLTFSGCTYRPKHHFYENKNLLETYEEIKESYKGYKIKYIMNQGLENYLRDMYKKELKVRALQKTIDFER